MLRMRTSKQDICRILKGAMSSEVYNDTFRQVPEEQCRTILKDGFDTLQEELYQAQNGMMDWPL